MSDQEHSPEPWVAAPSMELSDAAGDPVAEFFWTPDRDFALACVNACAGIAEPEKAIPALVEALQLCNEVLTEPGIMDVDEWKALQRRAVGKARAALALVQPPRAAKTVRERERHRAAQAEAAMANDPDLEGHTEKEDE